MTRKSSRRGSGLLIVMVFSGIVSLLAAGWWAMSDFQERAISRRIATNVGKDQNSFALEMVNEMILHRMVSMATLNPPHLVTTTFWVAHPIGPAPTHAINWTFYPGYDKVSGEVPTAHMDIDVCDARTLKMKDPATDLLAAYNANPKLPTACTTHIVSIIIEGLKNGNFVHLTPSVVVPL